MMAMNISVSASFEAFTAVKIQVEVFLVVATVRLLDVATQKTSTWICVCFLQCCNLCVPFVRLKCVMLLFIFCI